MQLSEKEKAMLQEYITYYATEDSLEPEADIDYILRFWKESKEKLYNLFGKNLILQKSIQIKTNNDYLSNNFSECFSDSSHPLTIFKTNFAEILYEKFCNDDLLIYCQLQELFKLKYLQDNEYTGSNFEFVSPAGKTIKVRKGVKLMKILGKIAVMYNIDGFEDFRIAHSQILNQKYLTGELCLSIHPMDYFTMSDNNCDWSSCMSWTENGEHRMGTVEMMNSPYVVIAYLKAKEDWTPYGTNFSWNNKKWRQLFIVHPAVIMEIKSYPYKNEELTTYVLDWLRKLASSTHDFGPYEKEACMLKQGAYIASHSFNFSTYFMYNDVYSKHKGYVAKDLSNYPPIIDIHYSGKTECMICGADISHYNPDIELSPTCVSCRDCGGFIYCSECGERIYDEDFAYDGLCQNCYEENYSTCSVCGEIESNENFVQVYLKHEGKIEWWYSATMCDSCFDNITQVYWSDNNSCYYIETSELTDEIVQKFFGCPSIEDLLEDLQK